MSSETSQTLTYSKYTHTVGLHLCKAQEQAILIYSDKNQKEAPSEVGIGAIDGKEPQGNFGG